MLVGAGPPWPPQNEGEKRKGVFEVSSGTNNLPKAIDILITRLNQTRVQSMQILVKAILVLAIAFIGLIVGAIITYFVASLAYIAIFGSDPVANSYECARGMAVGWLSLFGGALVGFCLGGCWGYRIFERGSDACESN